MATASLVTTATCLQATIWKRAKDSGERVEVGAVGDLLVDNEESYDDEARAIREAEDGARHQDMTKFVALIPPDVWTAAPTEPTLLMPWTVWQARKARGDRGDLSAAYRMAKKRLRPP